MEEEKKDKILVEKNERSCVRAYVVERARMSGANFFLYYFIILG